MEFNLDKSTPTDMRFRQLDAVTLLEPGERIEARKTVSGDEDYLKDHFPRFATRDQMQHDRDRHRRDTEDQCCI